MRGTFIDVRRPDDFHVHLREGEILRTVAPLTAGTFARALVMPNTEVPILTGPRAFIYRERILESAPGLHPLMAIKLVGSTFPSTVKEAASIGVVAGKLYPVGVTTNSDDGVRDILGMYPVFEAMEECGMVLCLHGEMPGGFCLDREVDFLPELETLACAFPRLKMVLEHVTTAAGVEVVSDLPDNVAATITVHHLYLTLDDVIGGTLRPHRFCKPVPKREADRTALAAAALGGNPKFFLGTDSAPHAVSRKEGSEGAAGVFTAPVAMPLLAAFFEERGMLPNLGPFTSDHGAGFYGLPRNEGKLRLERVAWKVPAEYGGVVPFFGGETLPWRVAE